MRRGVRVVSVIRVSESGVCLCSRVARWSAGREISVALLGLKPVGMRGHDVGGRDGREKREYALYYDYVLSCNYDTGVTGV